jgi:hypothetical protein|tara:strand:+ start:8931 stop:9395 length:465 start_codon:yes stop_codon:yes gene_type:complete
MKHQLIKINPLERASSPIGGFPPIRQLAKGQEFSSPDGYTYVPIMEKPEVPDGKEVIRNLTKESDTWEIVDSSQNLVFQEVSRLQLRLAIINSDILNLEDLDAAISSKGTEAKVRWDHADFIPVDHPLVIELKNDFNLSDEQVDTIFIEASQII